MSAIDVAEPDVELSAAREVHGLHNLSFVEGDLTDRAFVDELLQVHEPETVVHTAAQPSAPYSQINGERANFIQHNNMQPTRNLVFGLAENDLADTHLIKTTITGVYGAPEFPIPRLARRWRTTANVTRFCSRQWRAHLESHRAKHVQARGAPVVAVTDGVSKAE